MEESMDVWNMEESMDNGIWNGTPIVQWSEYAADNGVARVRFPVGVSKQYSSKSE